MKRLVVNDWVFQKIAREHKAPRIWSNRVDAIFGETEKAYHVLMGSVNHTVYTWVPKSQCHYEDEEHEIGTYVVDGIEQANEVRDMLRSYFG